MSHSAQKHGRRCLENLLSDIQYDDIIEGRAPQFIVFISLMIFLFY